MAEILRPAIYRVSELVALQNKLLIESGLNAE